MITTAVTSPDAEVEVLLSEHALDRVFERCEPELRGVSSVKAELREGLRAGNVSAAAPLWLGPSTRPAEPGSFYVWAEERDRAFCCVWLERDKALLVLTCVVPDFSRCGIGSWGAAL